MDIPHLQGGFVKDVEDFYTRLGARVREARDEKDITQESLGLMVSLSRTSITNIEKGRQKLLLHTFLDISSALQISPEHLLPQTRLEELDQQVKDKIETYTPDTQEWIKAIVSSGRGGGGDL